MNYRIMEFNGQRYIEIVPNSVCIKSESDALNWVAICGEYNTQRLMLHAENLSPDFFQLSSGLAGAVLLKFSIYRIRVAAILTPELVSHGKFREMVLETNRGNEFRVFYDHDQAEKWLITG